MNGEAIFDGLREGLGGAAERLALEYLAEAPSSNSELKQRLAQGALSGPALLVVGAQPGGRGTRGRSWHMQPGRDLALTLALPGLGAAGDPRLSLAVGAAVAGALNAHYGIELGVKWPNDILAGPPGRERKTGGILLESASAPDGGGRWVFIGIGLNANSLPEDYPRELRQRLATLRAAVAGTRGVAAAKLELDLAELLAAVAAPLVRGLLGGGGIEPWLAAWPALDRTPGARWLYTAGAAPVAVTAREVLLGSGELVVETAAGAVLKVQSYTDLAPL